MAAGTRHDADSSVPASAANVLFIVRSPLGGEPYLLVFEKQCPTAGERSSNGRSPGARLRRRAPHFAADGNAGTLSMSRASCWMTTVALVPATIFLTRSSE